MSQSANRSFPYPVVINLPSINGEIVVGLGAHVRLRNDRQVAENRRRPPRLHDALPQVRRAFRNEPFEMHQVIVNNI